MENFSAVFSLLCQSQKKVPIVFSSHSWECRQCKFRSKFGKNTLNQLKVHLMQEHAVVSETEMEGDESLAGMSKLSSLQTSKPAKAGVARLATMRQSSSPDTEIVNKKSTYFANIPTGEDCAYLSLEHVCKLSSHHPEFGETMENLTDRADHHIQDSSSHNHFATKYRATKYCCGQCRRVCLSRSSLYRHVKIWHLKKGRTAEHNSKNQQRTYDLNNKNVTDSVEIKPLKRRIVISNKNKVNALKKATMHILIKARKVWLYTRLQNQKGSIVDKADLKNYHSASDYTPRARHKFLLLTNKRSRTNQRKRSLHRKAVKKQQPLAREAQVVHGCKKDHKSVKDLKKIPYGVFDLDSTHLMQTSDRLLSKRQVRKLKVIAGKLSSKESNVAAVYDNIENDSDEMNLSAEQEIIKKEIRYDILSAVGCSVYDKFYENVALMKTMHQCAFCKHTFPDKQAAESHVQRYAGQTPIGCLTCGQSFHNIDLLNFHKVRDHDDGLGAPSCMTCCIRFSSKSSLLDHMAKFHTLSRGLTPVQLYVDSLGTTRCDICNINIPSEPLLVKAHYFSAHELVNFSCTVCSKLFKRKYMLPIHGWLEHDKDSSCRVDDQHQKDLLEKDKAKIKILFEEEQVIISTPKKFHQLYQILVHFRCSVCGHELHDVHEGILNHFLVHLIQAGMVRDDKAISGTHIASPSAALTRALSVSVGYQQGKPCGELKQGMIPGEANRVQTVVHQDTGKASSAPTEDSAPKNILSLCQQNPTKEFHQQNTSDKNMVTQSEFVNFTCVRSVNNNMQPLLSTTYNSSSQQEQISGLTDLIGSELQAPLSLSAQQQPMVSQPSVPQKPFICNMRQLPENMNLLQGMSREDQLNASTRVTSTSSTLPVTTFKAKSASTPVVLNSKNQNKLVLKSYTAAYHTYRNIYNKCVSSNLPSCTFCLHPFPDKESLDIHISHYQNQIPAVCSVCQMRFHNIDLLNIHMVFEHTEGTTRSSCFTCKNLRILKSAFLQHISRTHSASNSLSASQLLLDSLPTVRCTICFAHVLKDAKLIALHRNVHVSTKILLPEDNKIIYSISGLNCCLCHRVFKDKYLLFFHAVLEHNADDLLVQNLTALDAASRAKIREMVEEEQAAKQEDADIFHHFWCPLCQTQLQNHRLEILEHVALHCHKTLSQSAQLRKQHGLDKSQVTRQTVTCPECREKIVDKGQCVNFHRLLHGQVDELNIHLRCKLCPAFFPSQKQLRHHEKTQHRKECGTSLPHEDTEICECCGVQFSNTKEMKKHQKLHAQIIYNCDICNRGLKTREALEKHRAKHNSDHYCCPHCGEQYMHKNSLEKHIMREHEKIKDPRYSCKMCPAFYSDITELRDHIATKHEGRKPYPCSVCSENFNTRPTLMRHTRREHEGLSPFICKVCGMSFYEKHILQRHMVTHGAPEPFSCRFCLRSFYSEISVRKHIRKVHKESLSHACNNCDLKFSSHSELVKHCKSYCSVKRKEKKASPQSKKQSQGFFSQQHSTSQHLEIPQQEQQSGSVQLMMVSIPQPSQVMPNDVGHTLGFAQHHTENLIPIHSMPTHFQATVYQQPASVQILQSHGFVQLPSHQLSQQSVHTVASDGLAGQPFGLDSVCSGSVPVHQPSGLVPHHPGSVVISGQQSVPTDAATSAEINKTIDAILLVNKIYEDM